MSLTFPSSLKKPKKQRIFADLIIPGKEKPFKNGCVIIENDLIKWVGKSSNIPLAFKNDNTYNDISVKVLQPGMWDCHCHFIGSGTNEMPSMESNLKMSESILVGRSIVHSYNALMGGFTSLREVGGCGWAIKQLIDEGTIIGPNIYHSGKILSTTGGHGDCHNVPFDWVKSDSKFSRLCDGISQCLHAVRQNIRLDATLIKICASGGVLSQLDSPLHQQFSNDEIKCIVEEAKRSKRIVAAHCHGKDGIMAAILNGCKTIEHGTYLDNECIHLMKQNNCILIPTRFVVEEIFNRKTKPIGILEESWKKGLEISDIHFNAIKLAIKNNITIACGTDMLFPKRWGCNGEELKYYVKAGMTELEAIKTATANGPLTLGDYYAPKSGQIKIGFDADLIGLNKNPLNDITILGKPNEIKIVWKSGVIVKNLLNKQTTSKL